MPLYAGICETDITPPPGVWMCGYAGRSVGAIGVHDPLYARALVADNGSLRLALLVADLAALDPDIVAQVREGVAAQIETEPEAVMLHCTHNHAGPYVKSYRAMGRRDEPYIDLLTRKLIGAARMAMDALQPVTFTYGEAAGQIGVNRRKPLPDGGVGSGPYYGGPVAPRVQSLCVQRADGRTLALLFCHACHPTTLTGHNLHFTAEWPGAAVTHLKRRIERGGTEDGWTEDALPFCLQGCCGDIDPVRRGSWEAVTANGVQIADAAHTARWNAHSPLNDRLGAQEVTLQLPLMPPPPLAECDRQIDEATARLEQALSSGADPGRLMLEEGLLDWAREIRTLAAASDVPISQPFTIQNLTLGGAHLLGFPAEMFVRYQLDLMAQCREPVLALSFTNGCCGYLPTAAEAARGGYEVDQAYKFYGRQRFAPECEPLVRAAAYRLLNLTNADPTPL